jgi:hypothetical protein
VVQRWRGAVWVDADLPWLVAAGQREEGSPENFYTALAARGSAARARYNAEHSPPVSSTTYSEYLLPGHEVDRTRFGGHPAPPGFPDSYLGLVWPRP